jgi:hypothetical protein
MVVFALLVGMALLSVTNFADRASADTQAQATYPVASSSTGGSPNSPVGLIVPLYMYPNSYWDQLAQAKSAYPAVSVIAIINPSNGPGSSRDPNIAAGVQQLKAVGIIVYGYVDTVQASVRQSAVESQMRSYLSWYGVSGIFLDNVPGTSGHEKYYSALTTYAHSLGLATEGNPGWEVPSSYIPTMDSLMIYETNGLPTISYLQGAAAGYSASHFSFIATKVPSVPSQSYLDQVSQYAAHVWITNQGASYLNLPSTSYLDQLMSELAAT